MSWKKSGAGILKPKPWPPRQEQPTIEWAAGLFDGEGCIHISRSLVPEDDRFEYGTTLKITMAKAEQVLLDFRRAIGGIGRVNGPLSTRKEHHQPQWAWVVYKQIDVYRTALALLPYLRVKRREMLLMVEYLVLALKPGRQWQYTKAEARRRDALYWRLRRAKRGGLR